MYVCHLTFVQHPVKREGQNSDLWSFSVTFFHAIIIIVNIRLVAYSWLLNILNLIAIIFTSLGLFFLYGWISNFMWYSKTYQTYQVLYQSIGFYTAILFCVGTSTMIDFSWAAIRLNFKAPCHHFVRIKSANRKITEDDFKKIKELNKKEMHFYQQLE